MKFKLDDFALGKEHFQKVLWISLNKTEGKTFSCSIVYNAIPNIMGKYWLSSNQNQATLLQP